MVMSPACLSDGTMAAQFAFLLRRLRHRGAVSPQPSLVAGQPDDEMNIRGTLECSSGGVGCSLSSGLEFGLLRQRPLSKLHVSFLRPYRLFHRRPSGIEGALAD